MPLSRRRLLRTACAGLAAAALRPDASSAEAHARDAAHFSPPRAWRLKYGVRPEHAREVRGLPGHGLVVWGASRPSRRGEPDVEFTWTRQSGVEAGLLVDGAGRVSGAGQHWEQLQAPRRAAQSWPPVVAAGPDRFPEQRSGPLRRPVGDTVVIRALALFTLRALFEVGGSREVLRHALESALATANQALSAPEVAVAVTLPDLLPVTADAKGIDAGTVGERCADARDVEFGQPVQSLSRTVGAHLAVTVIGRGGGRDRAYTARARDGGVPCVVVRVGELAFGDLTLAHELGHAFGLEHEPPGSRGGILAAGAVRRDRVYRDGPSVRRGALDLIR